MTDDELNEIETRQCAGDVPALVVELRRLRNALGLEDGERLIDGDNGGYLAERRTGQRYRVNMMRAEMEELRSLRKLLSQSIDMDGPNRGRWVWVADGPIPADEETQA